MWILSLGMKADADDGRGKGGFPFFCFSGTSAPEGVGLARRFPSFTPVALWDGRGCVLRVITQRVVPQSISTALERLCSISQLVDDQNSSFSRCWGTRQLSRSD